MTTPGANGSAGATQRTNWFATWNAVIDVHGARLGPTGIAVYAVLARHAKEGHAWPSYERIAALLGIHKRTAIRAVELLRELGLITFVASPGRRANVYTLVDLSQLSQTNSDNRSTVNGDTPSTVEESNGDISSANGDISCTPTVTPRAPEGNKEKGTKGSSSSKRAAAAQTEARKALQALGLSDGLATRYAASDPDKALAIAPWLQERLADESRPVDNRVGFIRGALKAPENYGFTHKNGCWEHPPSEGKAKKVADKNKSRREFEDQLLREREADAKAEKPTGQPRLTVNEVLKRNQAKDSKCQN